MIMKKTILTVMILLSVRAVLQAQPAKLPDFSLADPQGGMHSSVELVASGLVVVITSPTLHEKDAQEGWTKFLTAAKGNNPAAYIMIEDLSASDFKGIARNDMKKDWQTGDIPMLLIDETGKTRDAFGVARNNTKVFVYDKKGNLLYSVADSPSAALAATVWSKLSK